MTSIKFLKSVGFIIHPEKSMLLPKQEITFLVFNINSQKIEINLTDTKKAKKETLKACYSELLHKNNQTIRYVAKGIGLMASSLSGVKYGVSYYKYLAQDKTNGLKLSKECFDFIIILPLKQIILVRWWYNKTNCSKNNITKGEPVIEILFDASSFSWGAICNNFHTGGAFNLDKMEYHINAKELVAARFSLKIFVKESDVHTKFYLIAKVILGYYIS